MNRYKKYTNKASYLTNQENLESIINIVLQSA